MATSVLFIGNSYTFYHGGLPRHFKDMFAAAPEPLTLEADMVTSGGKELTYLYESTDAVERIRNESWDVVILQGGFNDPVLNDKHAEFREYVRKFHDVIVESGAQPIIWAVWEQKVHKIFWNTWRSIDRVTHEIADSLEMPVVPIGTVWGNIRRGGRYGYWEPSDPGEPYAEAEAFLYHDDVHPTEYAVHMNALIFYSYLMGETCVGLDYEDVNGEYTDAEMEDTVQARVWNIVKDRLWEDPTSVYNAPSPDNGRHVLSIASSAPHAFELYLPNGVLVTRGDSRHTGSTMLPSRAGSGAFVVRTLSGEQQSTRVHTLTK